MDNDQCHAAITDYAIFEFRPLKPLRRLQTSNAEIDIDPQAYTSGRWLRGDELERNVSGTRFQQRARVPEAWRGLPHNKLYGAGPIHSHLVKFNLAVANLAIVIAKRGVEIMSA